MSNISKINGFQITAQSASYAATASMLIGSVTAASTASFVTASNVYGPYGANSVLSASWAPGSGGGTTFSAGNVNNRIITATGTTPELNGEASMSFDGTTFRVTGSMIANDGTYDSINTSTRTLTDSAGTLAVNWDAPNVGIERRLFDDNGTDSVDWAGRRLLDDGANLSIDWGNPASGTYRNLVDSAGKSSADWENRELRDNVETSSIDWVNRIMRDANGTVAINWYSPISGNERKMFDAASTQSIAWNNRILYNENGIPVLDWFTANSAWFSGSVAGTASFADRATTASFAVSASWAPGSGGVTINNNTDNYLVTATGTAATLNGEANATFNGSTLAVTGNVTANSFTGSLQGTATTASFVEGANVSGNITGNAANITAYTINQNLSTTSQVTFAGVTSSLNVSGETASRILSTDASKNIKTLDTTTYPDLTELSYVKGVTSAIQTQLNGKEPTITNGFGISGTTTKSVSLTTAEAFCTAETTLSATAYADITGASITLAAGTWLILATINGSSQTTTVAVLIAAITDGANTVIAEGAQHIVAGTATVRTWGNVSLSAIVSPGASTTYKLRGARGQTTQTGNVIVSDGTGQGTANNVSNNSDKSTSIRAIRIA